MRLQHNGSDPMQLVILSCVRLCNNDVWVSIEDNIAILTSNCESTNLMSTVSTNVYCIVYK